MSTTINGNPTGVAAPSVQPGPDTIVSMTVPVDGDAANAASVTQMVTALANEQAWEKAPTAAAPAVPGGLDAAYVQPVKGFRNGRGLRRLASDHFGFRNGNTIEWDEQWDEPELQLVNTTGNTNSRRWAFHTDGSGVLGGVLTSHPPQWITAAEGHRLLGITSIGTGGRADIQLRSNMWTGCFTDDLVVAMYCPFFLQVGAVADCTFLLGFTTNFQPSSAITDGAYMFKTPSNANWQFTTVSGGVATAAVDTGVPTGTGVVHRFGLALVGANQSDDSTARAILFLDGNPVANVASNLPYTTGGAGAGLPLSPIMGVNTSNGASATEFYVGPIRYRQNMFAGDNVI